MDLISIFSDRSIIKRNLETVRNYSEKDRKDKFELALLFISLIFLLIITPILLISTHYVPKNVYLLLPISLIPWFGLVCSLYAFILSQYFPVDKYYSDNYELSVIDVLIHNILYFVILLVIIYITYLIYTTVPVLSSDPLVMEVNSSPMNNTFVIPTGGYSKFTVRGDVEDSRTCIETCKVHLDNPDTNEIEVHSNWLHLRYGEHDYSRDFNMEVKQRTGWPLPYYLGYNVLYEDDSFDGSYESSDKITSIKNWGDTKWISMRGLFVGANNLTIDTNDTPYTSHVERMDFAFKEVQSINSDNINNWDTSNVEDMSYMFYNVNNFNQDVSSWDTSNVEDMSYMFYNVNNFNNGCLFTISCKKLSWNTGEVTDMRYMFYNTSFNQSIRLWDTSNVEDMRYMFYNTSFNQDISSWNTSNVENMGSMFNNARRFNKSLDVWRTGNVTYMGYMFYNTSFNSSVGSWNTSNVESMSYMFYNSSFNRSINSWDTRNVEMMKGMFSKNSEFNQKLRNWNIKNVVSTGMMFEQADKFNQSLNDWDTSNVESMGHMFSNTDKFNRSLNNWNTSSATYMSGMFANATRFNQDISSWDTSNVEDMETMFCNASNFNQNISSWDTSNVEDMYKMFYNASNFNQNINNWDINRASIDIMLSGTSVNRTQYNTNKWKNGFIEPVRYESGKEICY